MPRATVRDYMTEHVYTARTDATFKQIAELMTVYEIGSVPIVTEDGALAGIVTEGDLLHKEARNGSSRGVLAAAVGDVLHTKRAERARKAAARTARDLMTTPVLTTDPGEALFRAARKMVRRDVKRLVVVDGHGHSIGILSRHDVLHAFDQPDQAVRDAVASFLRENASIEPDARIEVRVDDGVVSLEGHVRFEGERRIAEALAVSVDGVVGVENRIRFDQPDPRLYVS